MVKNTKEIQLYRRIKFDKIGVYLPKLWPCSIQYKSNYRVSMFIFQLSKKHTLKQTQTPQPQKPSLSIVDSWIISPQKTPFFLLPLSQNCFLKKRGGWGHQKQKESLLKSQPIFQPPSLNILGQTNICLPSVTERVT